MLCLLELLSSYLDSHLTGNQKDATDSFHMNHRKKSQLTDSFKEATPISHFKVTWFYATNLLFLILRFTKICKASFLQGLVNPLHCLHYIDCLLASRFVLFFMCCWGGGGEATLWRQAKRKSELLRPQFDRLAHTPFNSSSYSLPKLSLLVLHKTFPLREALGRKTKYRDQYLCDNMTSEIQLGPWPEGWWFSRHAYKKHTQWCCLKRGYYLSFGCCFAKHMSLINWFFSWIAKENK